MYFLYFTSNMIRVTNKEDEMFGHTAHIETIGDAYKIIIG